MFQMFVVSVLSVFGCGNPGNLSRQSTALTSAVDCLERLISEMTYYVSSGTLNPIHSLMDAVSYQCNELVQACLKLRCYGTVEMWCC